MAISKNKKIVMTRQEVSSRQPVGRLIGMLVIVLLLIGLWQWSPFHADAPEAEEREPDAVTEQQPPSDENQPDQNPPSGEQSDVVHEQEHAHTNHLIEETSPYLLQHAHNPVNWYPWGEEAFARAKKENKPVFLSVGYSTCYWCHVMEVESFEDEEVAAVLNEHYIAIKVDREERPDIDEQYMLATQLMTRHGGWPNSVWLTPDGRPWMAGTYFPKQGFIQALQQLADVWKNQYEDVDRKADALAAAMREVSESGATEQVELTSQLTDVAVEKLVSRFDPVNGGFGGAPKFPPHGTLQVLIQQYRATGDKALLEPVSRTLDAMWLGGMHDHIGGGFHRYSTDSVWLLPHFEKMLYDNAQLMRAYADGWQLTGNEQYRDAVADIYRWVSREMTSPEGAFYSALDSGEVGAEGEAYVWPLAKLSEVLGAEDGAYFAEVYGFQEEGNYREESNGERSGKNIPHLKQPIDTLAPSTEGDAPDPVARLAELRDKLLAERLTWPQPHKDDKVLTSWNGLMIGALARAGRLLEEPDYVEAAGNAAQLILDEMVRDDKLLRTRRNDDARLPGYLDDYVFFIQGLLEMHEATEDARWLEQAERFAQTLLNDFEDQDGGGFFFTTASHDDLVYRSRHLSGGGNMPNPNGVAAQVLILLAQQTGRQIYQDAAERTLTSLSGMMATQPHSSEDLLVATSQYLADENLSGGAVAQAAEDELSQRAGPVAIQVSSSETAIAAGDSFTIQVEADIDSGWHLYAENPDAEFLIPCTVTVAEHDSFTIGSVEAPEAESKEDPILKETVNIYHGRITFRIPVTVAEGATEGTAELTISVRTQACDEERCLKPQTTTFRLPLEVGPADAGSP